MKMGSYIILLMLIIGCTDSTATTRNVNAATDATEEVISEKPIKKSKKIHLDKSFELVDLKEIEMIPPPGDSISFHIVFQLEDDLFVAVAEPVEHTFEGVRLQLIKEKKNKKLHLLDESSPGYDSPQLFPTFFRNQYGEYIIIANMGISDSWGAKVYSLINNKFSDMGYVDMAALERREFPNNEGKMDKYVNLSKYTSINSIDGELVFSFSADKMILFEDNDENREVKFSKGEFDYLYDNKSWILRKN